MGLKIFNISFYASSVEFAGLIDRWMASMDVENHICFWGRWLLLAFVLQMYSRMVVSNIFGCSDILISSCFAH